MVSKVSPAQGSDQEEQFLMLIKQRCGAMWTKHQEQMISDIKQSDGLHKSGFGTFRYVTAQALDLGCMDRGCAEWYMAFDVRCVQN